MENAEYLSVSSVAEILYCPRNFYYRAVLGAQDRNSHVLEGKWQEDIRDEVKHKQRPTGLQTRKVYLSSDLLRLAGVLDTVEEQSGQLYPVEYKKGSNKDNINDQVQLCLQAFLLEENLQKTILSGYIYYSQSNERKEVVFNDALRETAMDALEHAKVIMEEGIVPEPVNDKRCNGCSLVDRCLPEESNAIISATIEKPRRPSTSLNLGRTLYVDVPGAYLRKEQGRIKLKMGEEVQTIPLSAVDQVVLGQPASVTGSLLAAMCDQGITCFVMEKGKVKGWVQPLVNKNVVLRKAQYETHLNKSPQLAKLFVQGKVANTRTMLVRYNRNLKDEQLEKAIESLAIYLKKIKDTETIQELMGFEGIAAREYFAVFAKLFKENVEFNFTSRNRRPPKDPVNCLLSYAYSLLTRDVIEAIIKVGLDPYIGFFHSEKYGRPALALDMMEEFRPIIADSVVITAINTKIIKNDDFEQTIGGCEMKEAARKRFFQAYQTRLNQEATHPLFKYKVTYRRMLELQVRFLGKVLTGEWPRYTPYMVR